MSCITAPKIPIASIPGLSLLLGDISIAPPDLSANLCCQISIPLPPVVIPIGSALGTLKTASPAALETTLATINTTIEQINTLLDQLSFDCPLD